MAHDVQHQQIQNIITHCNRKYDALYRQPPIRWRDITLSEIVAKEILGLFKCSEDGASSFRKNISSFCRDTYNTSASHLEQLRQRRKTDYNHKFKPEHAIEYGLFWQQKTNPLFDFGCLGNILDHQVPLLDNDRKDSENRKNCGGEIDLVSTNNNILYLLELKCKTNTESILRCVLEIYTYYCRIKDLSRLKADFNMPASVRICISPLVFKDMKQDIGLQAAIKKRGSQYDLFSLINDDLERDGNFLSFSTIESAASVKTPWDMPQRIKTASIKFSDLK